MVFAFITVVITVHAFVFYSIYKDIQKREAEWD